MSKAHANKKTREPEVIEELRFDDVDALRLLCGERDRNLRSVEARYGITLHPRGNMLRLIGRRAAVADAAGTIDGMYRDALAGKAINVDAAFAPAPLQPLPQQPTNHDEPTDDVVLVTYKNTRIGPRTGGQRSYLSMINRYDVVFAIGPAGTGKTYLAVLVAVQQLLAGRVSRIILARPAVEAGERLGYLPGDLAEKVNPYLRPLYDALHDMLPFERVQQMMESGEIEIAPLAFMRGRTLNNAFIILDEAQNSTPEQMKMFLTRIGHSSRVVVTGDLTQTDLPPSRRSGLGDALQVLEDVEDIGVVRLGKDDIVRHNIVQTIINAYGAFERMNPKLPLEEDSP